MLKRLNISIFKPSKIAFFLKDKLGYITLYIAFLSLLASMPMILRIGFSNSAPKDIKDELTSTLIQKNNNCVIVDAKLDPNCTGEAFNYLAFRIGFNDNSENALYQVVFEEESLSFYLDQTNVRTYTYQTLKLDNLSLNLATSNDQKAFKNAIDIIYMDIKPLALVYGGLMMFMANMILYFILGHIMAFFYGLRPQKLRYRYRFIMATYALTSYFVLVLIGELYGLGLVSYLALILPYIYMGIAFRGLLKMSKIVIVSDQKDDESKDKDE